MPKYTVDYLYNEFGQLAGMRNNPEYANDAGYWTGGRCNWGGSHNLREDCGTLAQGFEKMESLDGEKIKAELNKCTSQGEYESKKADYIRKANEISGGLQARTGYSSSVFGVCIIWADQAMSPYVENKMQDCRRNLENLKSQITEEKYQHIEELKKLKFEENKLRRQIEENRRKAAREKDPAKKRALLLLIEEDGKRLEENLKKQQAIPASGINFDPNKYISDMINGIRKALQEKSGGSGDNNGGGDSDKPKRPKKPDDPWDDDNDKGDKNKNDNCNKRPPRKKNQPEQNNQQMLLIGVAVLVVLFLLMNQKSDHSRHPDYDYDY